MSGLLPGGSVGFSFEEAAVPLQPGPMLGRPSPPGWVCLESRGSCVQAAPGCLWFSKSLTPAPSQVLDGLLCVSSHNPLPCCSPREQLPFLPGDLSWAKQRPVLPAVADEVSLLLTTTLGWWLCCVVLTWLL